MARSLQQQDHRLEEEIFLTNNHNMDPPDAILFMYTVEWVVNISISSYGLGGHDIDRPRRSSLGSRSS
jgi:hypothetical protein